MSIFSIVYNINSIILSSLIIKYLPSEPTIINKRNSEFDIIFNDALKSNGSILNYESKYSKYDFLRYIVEKEPVILHGSSKVDLKILKTKTLYNNRQLLYATKNVLHSMGHAFRDTNKNISNPIYTGSFEIRGNNNFKNPAFISVNKEVFVPQGMIYILPIDSFVSNLHNSRISKLTDGKIKNRHSLQWISCEPVLPLIKLPINVEDLPFGFSMHDENEPYIFTIIKFNNRNRFKFRKLLK